MPNDKFYTSIEWRNLRKYKLSINPFCENKECKNFATEVHHKKERRYYKDLELDINNLQSLCKPCHSKHTYSSIKRSFEPYKLMW